MNNLLCIIILKILIFLRFFPGSLFVKNFQLLLSSFLINLKMAKSFVHRPNFEVPTETKIYHQLINNQTKMTLYLLNSRLILTNNLLTSTIREVRRNSKENFWIDIGTSRIKVTVVNCFHIPIHTILCRHSLQV